LFVAHPSVRQVIEFVRNKQWKKARVLSDKLLEFITNSAALGTLEDVRRCARGPGGCCS
jgi:hypothetical protein